MGISHEQALECFRSDDLIGLGMEADAVLRRLHPEGVVSYALGCQLDCARLCGAEESQDGYRRDGYRQLDALIGEIAEAVGDGATAVHLRNVADGSIRRGCDGMLWAERALRELRRRVPAVWIEGFTSAEIVQIGAACELSAHEVISHLQDAGLDAIADDGPALADTGAVAQWIEAHRAAHGLGMRTVAGMVFGADETPEQRVDFLEAVRALHEEAGGFSAFVPTAAPAPNGRQLDGVTAGITAIARLKTLAVARMFLDNIENVQADGAASGIDGVKVLQTALRFGANDAGVIAVGDAGRGRAMPSGRSEEDLRRIIRDAGFRPAQRDAAYRVMMLG